MFNPDYGGIKVISDEKKEEYRKTYTSIRIRRKILKRLNKLKKYTREPYDDLLDRLMKPKEREKERKEEARRN